MTAIPPMVFEWTGDEMRPLHPKRADQHFVIGQRYTLVEHQERSQATHNHFFAAVHEGWQNLPEHLAEQFPTDEHLRKWCLIQAGYSDSQTFVASSKAEAVRLAAFLRPLDEFSVVTIQGATVSRFTAKSQSMRAMGKQDFAASKQAVLDLIAGMIGTDAAALQRHAEAA